MTSVYYKYAIAAIIVFDVSRPATFDAVSKWREDVNSKVMLPNKQPIPTLLLANKCDIPGITIDKEALDKYVQDNGFIGWFQTSASENVNIDDAMKYLITKVLDVASQIPQPKPDSDTIQLTATTNKSTSNSKQQNSSNNNDNSCCS